MGVDLLDALSPHKGTDKDEEGGCGKVEIRDELVDDAKCISRSDIDRGRKTKWRILGRNDNIMDPIMGF